MSPPHPLTPWPIWLRVVVVVLVAVALSAPLLIWREPIGQAFANREQVAAEIRGAGAWGPLVVIALVIAQTIVAPIPGQVVGFAAGYIYGFGVGLALCWAGQMAGAAAAMALARGLGRPLVRRLIGATALERVDRLAGRGGLRFFFLVFLIPGLPDDLASFAAGLTQLPLRLLLLAAAIGRTPGIAGSVWVGATAERLPWQGWLALALTGAAAAALLWRYGGRIEAALMGGAGRKTKGESAVDG
jgi:uncharacterized membrane protein YdjX (TVP38/TMEM64 family)